MKTPIQFESYSNELDTQERYSELRSKYLYQIKWLSNIHIINSIFSNSWEHIKGIELGFTHSNNYDYDLILLPYPKQSFFKGEK